jgi:tRNA U34 5-methylaminomethyl-2-thiouridine-forming methyltransferase MnmC
MLETGSPSSFGEVVPTADGSLTIRHPDANECYHSTVGAAFEAQTLYIQHSGVTERLAQATRPIRVLDVGMGLGYNALSTVAAWAAISSPSAVELVSLEINPDLAAALASGTAPWQRGWRDDWTAWSRTLRKVQENHEWRAVIAHPSSPAICSWRVVIGDAASQDLAALDIGSVDYIWQDPFSPQRNPSLWSAAWFAQLKSVATPDCKLMTYSVARLVKDNLAAAGWRAERFETGLQKRHWLRASPEVSRVFS